MDKPDEVLAINWDFLPQEENDKVRLEHDCAKLLKTKSMVKCPYKMEMHTHSDVPLCYKIFNYRGAQVLDCFESYLLPYININLNDEHDGHLSTYYLMKLFFIIRTYYRAALSGRSYLLESDVQFKIEEYNKKLLMIIGIQSNGNSCIYNRRLDNTINFRFLQDLNGSFSEHIRIVMPEYKIAARFGEPILISIPVSTLWQQEPKPSLYCNCPDLPKIMEVLKPTWSNNRKYICIYKKLVRFGFFESAHPHFLEIGITHSKTKSKVDVNIVDSSNIENEKPINLVVTQEKAMGKETFKEELTDKTLEFRTKEVTGDNKGEFAEFLANIDFANKINKSEEIDVVNYEPVEIMNPQLDSEKVGDLLIMGLSMQRPKINLGKRMRPSRPTEVDCNL